MHTYMGIYLMLSFPREKRAWQKPIHQSRQSTDVKHFGYVGIPDCKALYIPEFYYTKDFFRASTPGLEFFDKGRMRKVFFKEKKGQSALEYLMTYGWALVVIVIVVAALVFLIQPSQVGGNTCSTTSGILITNHQVSTDSLVVADNNITLILSNQTASQLGTATATVTGTVGGGSLTVTNYDLTAGGTDPIGTTQETKVIPFGSAFNAGAYSLSVTFNYVDRDGLPRTVTSTCNGTSS